MSVFRRPVSCICLCLLSTLLASAGMGCGGGGTAAREGAQSLPTGRATFSIKWPAPTRLIPAASKSIKVEIKNGPSPIVNKVLVRPSGGGTTTASFDSVPIGSLTVAATAYPQTDGTGVGQATASVPLVIEANKTTPFSLTMASTIDHVTMSPANVTVPAGQSKQLVATAFDSTGNIVLTSALNWSSSNTAAATVSSSGLVTGVFAGSAQIMVSETESGRSVSMPASVTPSYQPVVAYQINPAHSGRTSFGAALTFPAAPAWTVDLGGQGSYPLVVGGIVYITTSGSQLFALDVSTGAKVWGPVSVAAPWSGIAYDNGKIFVVNAGGTMWSYDAVTGVPGWSIQLTGQYSFSSAPTAVHGTVYTEGAGTGGTLYAVNENTGAVIWRAPVANGQNSSPAVTDDGVYVSHPLQTYKFSPAGSQLWHYNGPGDGGGGRAPVFSNGKLYARDWAGPNIIFDGATGAKLGNFSAGPIPAIGATLGYFQDATTYDSPGTLRGIDLASGATVWSFAGDGGISSAALIIDNTVFIGSFSGNIYALDGTTGAQLWSANSGGRIYHPDEQNLSQPVTGFAAAEGYLFVPAGNTLTAWKLAGP